MLGSNFKRSIWGLGLIGFAWICFLGHAAEISTTRIKATDAQFGTMSSARANIIQATISSATIPSANISSATIERLNFSTISGPIINSTAYVSSYASLNAAVAAIGTTQTKLLVNEATTLTGNLSIPATLMVEVTRAGSINYGAYTLTFSGGNNSIQAGRYAIFSGAGSVAGLQVAYPEWWTTNATPGTTDMTSGFTSALAAADVVEGEGLYAIADTVTMGDGQRLTGTMTLKAITGLASKPMIMVKEGDGTAAAWNVEIPAGVTLDGNDIAQTGIEVYRARGCKFYPSKITRVTTYGFLLGDAGSSTSDGCNIYNTEIWYHESYTPVLKGGSYANPSGSIGIYNRNCADSNIYNVTVIGFRVGFQTSEASGSISYTQCHAWSRRAHGPMIAAFRSYGSGGTYTQCYADTPHNWYSADGSTYVQDASITAVYGWYIDSYSQALTNCKVYMNPSTTYGATDALVTAAHFAKAEYGYIFGLQIQGGHTSYRFNYIYGGTTTNATILGTGYPVTGTLVNATSRFDQVGLAKVNFAPVTLAIDGAAETFREMEISTDGVSRWFVGANTTAEGGSNAGSDFSIRSRADDGSRISTPFTITRSTGYVTLGNTPTYADNAAAISGGLAAGQLYKTTTGDLRIVYTP